MAIAFITLNIALGDYLNLLELSPLPLRKKKTQGSNFRMCKYRRADKKHLYCASLASLPFPPSPPLPFPSLPKEGTSVTCAVVATRANP